MQLCQSCGALVRRLFPAEMWTDGTWHREGDTVPAGKTSQGVFDVCAACCPGRAVLVGKEPVEVVDAIDEPMSYRDWDRHPDGGARLVDAAPPEHRNKVHVKRVMVRRITTQRARAAWIVWEPGAHRDFPLRFNEGKPERGWLRTPHREQGSGQWVLCRDGAAALALAAFLVDTRRPCDRAAMASKNR